MYSSLHTAHYTLHTASVSASISIGLLLLPVMWAVIGWGVKMDELINCLELEGSMGMGGEQELRRVL